jgi:hypothetical protein
MILSEERIAKQRATVTSDQGVVNPELFIPPTSAVARDNVGKSTYCSDGLEPLLQQKLERERERERGTRRRPRCKVGISVRKA